MLAVTRARRVRARYVAKHRPCHTALVSMMLAAQPWLVPAVSNPDCQRNEAP